MQARYYGPSTVDKKISDVNFIVHTPGRRKQNQLCHVNMLKQYIDRNSSSVTPISVVSSVTLEQSEMSSENINLVVWEDLCLVIVALPGLFSYFF